MAPLAVVWISGLGELAAGRLLSEFAGWRAPLVRALVAIGLIAQAVELATIHPHELSFFNRLGGGTIGGRRILADSNLDWGQGLRSLARLEAKYRDLTLFYFGDTAPEHYGIKAPCSLLMNASFPRTLEPVPTAPTPLAAELEVGTRYVAVSASLQHGPWGPAGYFRALDSMKPVALTDDGTIAIYDLEGSQLYRPSLASPGDRDTRRQ
jgi:hypothetical protein